MMDIPTNHLYSENVYGTHIRTDVTCPARESIYCTYIPVISSRKVKQYAREAYMSYIVKTMNELTYRSPE